MSAAVSGSRSANVERFVLPPPSSSSTSLSSSSLSLNPPTIAAQNSLLAALNLRQQHPSATTPPPKSCLGGLSFGGSPCSAASSSLKMSPCASDMCESTTLIEFAAARRASKRLLDSDSDSNGGNSRDSGFESEVGRCSSTPSESTIGCSAPPTPASSSAELNIGKLHLCLWQDCTEPELSDVEADDVDLLGHVLSRHVQPLENRASQQQQMTASPPLFRCLWRGCKVFGRGSRFYSWLERHVVERHAGPRPFACPLPTCRARFNSKLLAERHVNSHFAQAERAATPTRASHTSSVNASPTAKQQQQDDIDQNAVKRRRPLPQQSPTKPIAQSKVATRRTTSNIRQSERNAMPKPAAPPVDGPTTRSRRSLQLDQPKESTSSAARSDDDDKRAGDRRQEADERRRSGCETRAAAIQKSVCLSETNHQEKNVIPSNRPATTSCAENSSCGTNLRRRSARVVNFYEDAFDGDYARAVHVLAARSILSQNGKSKNASSCQLCSGNNQRRSDTDFASQRDSSRLRGSGCEEVTFRAKVLAKRSLTVQGPDNKEYSKQQLYCCWIPAGFLPSKWVDEETFQPTTVLSRHLLASVLDDDQDTIVDRN